MLDVLASFAFSEMLDRRNNIALPHAETCQWILNHDEFKLWDVQPRGLLWIKGKPGAGKSTLMSFLYDRLKLQRHTKPGVHLDFFFSARGTELQHTPIGMLRSLLNQLFRQSSDARTLIRARYKERSAAFGQRSQGWRWQLPELQSMFLQVVIETARQEQVTIFVDALDEAGEYAARETARYFHQISNRVDSESATAKICISCRHYPIAPTGRGREVIVDHNNANDIASYVHDRLDLDPYVSDIQQWEQLENDLVKGANGVFQWVHLVLPIIERSISDGVSVKDVRDWLQEVPEELKSLYEHILQHVIDEKYRFLSLRLFQWVCLAERPLSVAEMRYALNAMEAFSTTPPCKINEARTIINSDEQMKQRIKALSGGLVEVIGSNMASRGRVQVIHQSVNDFLLSNGLTSLIPTQNIITAVQSDEIKPPVQTEGGQQHQWSIFKTLLVCLATENVLIRSIDDGTITVNKQRRKTQPDSPLVNYAAMYLPKHAKKVAGCSGVNISNEELLLQRINPCWADAYHAMVDNDYFRRVGWRKGLWSHQIGTTALHAAVAGDLSNLVHYLIQTGATSDAQDAEKNTPLHVAVDLGLERIARILLDAKAETNVTNAKKETPLLLAAARDHLVIFQLLVQYGASYHRTKRGYPEALAVAIKAKSINVTRHLINDGAHSNAYISGPDNILVMAASTGNEEIVRMLLATKTHVGMKRTSNYGVAEALKAAIQSYDNLVRKATKTGAGAIHDGSDCNPLSTVSTGIKTIIRRLLDFGADVDASRGIDQDSALHMAVKYGTDDIVRMILDAGASFNTHGSDGSPLQAAVMIGNENIVRILLDAGADVDPSGTPNRSALFTAVKHDKKSIIRILLKAGADVNAHNGTDYSVLHRAVRTSTGDIVQILLSAGADIDARINDGECPLHTAAARGHAGIVKILLDAGADVNAYKNNRDHPLHTAVARGKEEIVRMFLAHGANINTSGHTERSVLYAAVKQGNQDIVRMLLDAGADANANTTDGSALVKAVESRKQDIVKQLVVHKPHPAGALRAAVEDHSPWMWGPEYLKGDIQLAIVKSLLEAYKDVYIWGPELFKAHGLMIQRSSDIGPQALRDELATAYQREVTELKALSLPSDYSGFIVRK